MVTCWPTCSHGRFTICWCTSMRTLARSARGTGPQLLKVWPIIGQYPCWNFFSSQRALEAEAWLSNICLPSGRKPMARISAVTALCSHATFLRGVIGATYASTASISLAGCSLHWEVLSVSIWAHDGTDIHTWSVSLFAVVTTLTTPASAIVTGKAVFREQQCMLLCARFWGNQDSMGKRWVGMTNLGKPLRLRHHCNYRGLGGQKDNSIEWVSPLYQIQGEMLAHQHHILVTPSTL